MLFQLFAFFFKIALMVCVFTGGDAPEPDLCAEFFSRAEKPVAAIAADSGLETFGRYQDFSVFSI